MEYGLSEINIFGARPQDVKIPSDKFQIPKEGI
jgi:hypothetical protein